MTPSRFRELVEKALGELPEQFQTHVRNVQVTVKAAPGAEADGQPDADTLLGLYVGDPLTQQSATEPPLFPARIFIYRDSILQESGEDERLIVEEIRITVLHEIGHHLGLDDEEMAILEEE
ncbi:MAG: metallopeptidase family protein [Nitrospirae bacterium]|nr:metallopeptidase family protein [Nitrospirota bacterium]